MGAPVVLNIYDLSDYNTWMYWLGAGGKPLHLPIAVPQLGPASYSI